MTATALKRGALATASAIALAAFALSGAGIDMGAGLYLTKSAAAQGAGGQHGKGAGGSGGSTDRVPGAGQGQGGKGGAGKGGIDRILKAPPPDSDSDRPAWAGVKGGKSGGGGKPAGAGSKKGDLYGDLYFIVRDPNGVPVLVDGLPQVYAFVTDASGNLVPLIVDGQAVIIPRNEEGDLVTTVTIGTTTYNVVPGEIELGRTNVARSPSRVLDKALESVSTAIASATTVTIDASGRLVIDGATVDSPLENLALYVELMNPTVLSGSLDLSKLPTTYSTAAFLAAASDKTGTISVDTLVYLNSILKVNTVSGTTTIYYDYSTYNYDRLSTWSNVTATVLVLKDGVYVPTVVNIYEAVFSSTNWTDPTATGGADDFAKAADDYLQVIEYIHDNEVR
ncbi:hypothetical protein [Desertibaculum subflavum]|uniref:hypothetical protein n=1 Tax=Desertibaculum subflavum TaxID=2268458 RepID=UPI0013C51D2F